MTTSTLAMSMTLAMIAPGFQTPGVLEFNKGAVPALSPRPSVIGYVINA